MNSRFTWAYSVRGTPDASSLSLSDILRFVCLVSLSSSPFLSFGVFPLLCPFPLAFALAFGLAFALGILLAARASAVRSR